LVSLFSLYLRSHLMPVERSMTPLQPQFIASSDDMTPKHTQYYCTTVFELRLAIFSRAFFKDKRKASARVSVIMRSPSKNAN
jgi:hypothetical protein